MSLGLRYATLKFEVERGLIIFGLNSPEDLKIELSKKVDIN
jgi:hypothetical protein